MTEAKAILKVMKEGGTMGKQLTMDDIADLYDKEHTGRPARTLPMDYVFEWAKKQTGRFAFNDDGVLCLIEEAPQGVTDDTDKDLQ